MATRTTPPSTRRLAPLVLALATLAWGGAPPAGEPPVKVVALSPLELPYGFPDSAQAQAQALFERLLTLKLQGVGLTVVASSEAGAVWKRLVDSVGGYYDSFTGERVPALYEAVRAGAMREMRAKHGADAWLRPRLEVVDAPIYRGKAQWDGIEDRYNSSGGGGLVPALSLDLTVEDTAGAVLHRGRGGIGVLGKFRGGFWAGTGKVRPVSPEKMLADVKRPTTAVALALDEFLMSEPADSARKSRP